MEQKLKTTDFICPICNKKVDTTFKNKYDWGWRLDNVLYCSYSCYSKAFDKKGYKAFRFATKGLEAPEHTTRSTKVNYVTNR